MSDDQTPAQDGAATACPGCGAPTVEGAAFCHQCGHPLGASAPAAPAEAAPAAPSAFDAPPAEGPTAPPPPLEGAPPRGTTLPGYGAPARPPPGPPHVPGAPPAGAPPPPSAWPYAPAGAGASPYRAHAAPPPTGRSRIVAALLAFFLGGFGAHKFYLGRPGLGVLYLLFCWTLIPGLIAFVEFFILLFTSEETFNARYGHLPGGGGVVVLVVAGAAFAFVTVLGILAAIAIPNFIRYQLRSKASEATHLLGALDRAEQARLAAGEGYVVFSEGLPAGQQVGRAKVAWSDEDRAALEGLAWQPEAATWGRYAVDGQEDEEGNQAIALCAEMDLDEDGELAAVAIFRPALAADGSMLVPPPAAPCSAAVSLREGASLEFDPAVPPGTPVRLSPEDVF